MVKHLDRRCISEDKTYCVGAEVRNPRFFMSQCPCRCYRSSNLRCCPPRRFSNRACSFRSKLAGRIHMPGRMPSRRGPKHRTSQDAWTERSCNENERGRAVPIGRRGRSKGGFRCIVFYFFLLDRIANLHEWLDNVDIREIRRCPCRPCS